MKPLCLSLCHLGICVNYLWGSSLGLGEVSSEDERRTICSVKESSVLQKCKS